MSRTAIGAVALAIGAAACGSSDAPAEPGGDPPAVDDAPVVDGPFPFVEVARASGVDLEITSGRPPSSQILEVKGGGLALFELDGDGDADLFVPNGATLDAPAEGPGARVFRNRGDMTFEDATDATGLAFRRWGMGVAVGDVDASGTDDLFVACYGENALLSNEDGRLVERTRDAGLGAEAWHTAASFGDLDLDGDLDLYVVGYVVFDAQDPPPGMEFKGAQVFGGPMTLDGEPDRVYRNRGDGTFEDVTESAGFDAVPPSFGLGAVILDLDLDGDQDVYVGNDSQRNFFFRNEGDWVFRDVASDVGIASNADGHDQATMGIAIADVNGDARPDLFTTNFASDTNTLHVSRGDVWVDRTQRFGLSAVSRIYLGWAAHFADLDLDGDEDLVAFNGHVYPEAITEQIGDVCRQPPLLFERDGERFRRVEPVEGGWLADAHVDRSAVIADLDADGDLDLVVSELQGPVRLLRNEAAPGRWLTIELVDVREGVGNTHAYGARIELLGGDAPQTRWIVSGTGYQGASTPIAHFGLPADAANLTARVTWPDGAVQEADVEPARANRIERAR